MKITNLEVLRMDAPSEQDNNWLFVRIHTDEGLYGVGEGSLQYKDAALEAELVNFGTYLEGKDPFQIEHIWTSLHRRVTWTGGAVTISAISAIDLALWDLKARALGVPVYELAGGKVRDRVPLYANGWRGLRSAHGEAGDSFQRELDQIAASGKAVAEMGFGCLKIYPFGGGQAISLERLDKGAERVAVLREAVGPGVEIAIDCRARLNIWSARRAAKRLESYDIAWMEEPILFDNVDAMGAFARSVDVPIATGEQRYTRWEFRDILDQNAVGIIQPDICHAGGMSELRKIGAMAETYTVIVSPHNSNGPISTVASLHLDMTLPNAHMQELFLNSTKEYDEVLTNPISIADGYAAVPEGPGWGTDLDLEAIAAHPPSELTPVESEPYIDFY